MREKTMRTASTEQMKRRIDFLKEEIDDLEGQVASERERLSMLRDASHTDAIKIAEAKRSIGSLSAKLAEERVLLRTLQSNLAAAPR